jgi:hypothetical protein
VKLVMAYYFAILIIVLLIGLVKTIYILRQLKGDIDFYEVYMTHFNTYMESLQLNKENTIEYEWLVKNSTKMQRNLGGYGVINTLIDGRFQYSNVQVLLNLLPEMRKIYKEVSNADFYALRFEKERLEKYVTLIAECLLRYEGNLEESHDNAINQVKNPFSWLRIGTQWVVTFPISLMYWTGVIRYSWYNRLTDNFVIKLINFLVIIIGFASSIVTIVTGYNPFVDILEKSDLIK